MADSNHEEESTRPPCPATADKKVVVDQDTTFVGCCPPGSMGPAMVPLDATTKLPRGTMIEIPSPSCELVGMQPMPCYCTGPLLDPTTKRLVMIFSDVYGVDSGNTKVFADQLAQRLDCPVIIPDLFRGVPILQPWMDNSTMVQGELLGSLMGAPGMLFRIRQYPPAKIEQDIFQLILPFLQDQIMRDCQVNHSLGGGQEHVVVQLGCVGFCFGGWVVGRVLGHSSSSHVEAAAGSDTAASLLSFQCGVGIHPSFQPNLLHGEGQVTMAERIHKPILLLPAWNDFDLKPGSPIVNVIQHNLVTAAANNQNNNVAGNDGSGTDPVPPPPPVVAMEFPTMIHGWVTRGDVTNPTIAAEQERALQLTVDFIQKHCPPPSSLTRYKP